jgi:NB-ARC domain
MKSLRNLLSASEAAIYMGITKELLYAYVKNAPKKCKGDIRKLSSIVIDGQNYFEKAELDDFDAYLKEPWSSSASERPSIPTFIQDYLKTEIQGHCPITSKGFPLENAHIIPYSESLNHHHHNIIRISKEFHTNVDSGLVSRDVLLQTKDKLIQNLKQKIKNNTQLNRFTFEVPNPHPLYIGRYELMKDLVKAMSQTQLIIIEGIGGIGKSQLLIQAINSTEYYNPVVWIDIEQVNSFNDFLILFNNAVYEHCKLSFSDSGFEALVRVQITFVLDSLEKLLISERDKIEDFISELLLKAPNVQLLITSQIDLSLLDQSLKIFKLQGLGIDESTTLIDHLLNEEVKINDSELNWILDFCNGHPLSLKLIATLLNYYHSTQKLIQLLDNSKKIQHPTRQKHNKNTSLSVCLNTIYEILNEQQKKILHYLKFYPGGIIFEFLNLKYEYTSFLDDIALLQQFFFIEVKEDILDLERLIIPNPIRPFLNTEIEKEAKEIDIKIEKEAITDIMLSASLVDLHYISTGHYGSFPYGMMRLEVEMPNLLFASNIAHVRALNYEQLKDNESRDSYLRVISGISSAIGEFCFTRAYYKLGILFAQRGIEAYIKLNEYSFASSQYLYLAQIQSRLFDIKALKETVKNIKTLYEQTEDNVVIVKIFWIEGILNFDLRKYDQARKNFSDAKVVLERIIQGILYDETDDINIVSRDSDIGNLILLKSFIAKTHEYEKDFSKAVPIYEEIIENLPERFTEDNLGSIYHHYAYCLSQTGDIKKSVEYYTLSIDNFSKTGNFDYLANSISNLGSSIVEEYPEVINNLNLNENLILESLNCINNHLANIPNFLERIKNDPDIIPPELIGKIMGIIKAMSFSKYSYVLCEWVSDLLEEIPINLSNVSYLGAMLNLAHCVGGVSAWKEISENKCVIIKSILQCCLIINAGPDLKSKTKIFYWLAKWMQFIQLQSDATAEKLWEQALDSFDK